MSFSPKETIDAFLKKGTITRAEHDAFIAEIQKDGEVDEEESEQLSRLFKLVSEKKLTIVDDERAAAEAQKRKDSAQEPKPVTPVEAPHAEMPEDDDPYAGLRFDSRRTRAVEGSIASSALGQGSLTREQLAMLNQNQAETDEAPQQAPVISDSEPLVDDIDDVEVPQEAVEDLPEYDFEEDDDREIDVIDDVDYPAETGGEGLASLSAFASFVATEDEGFVPYVLQTDRVLKINLNGSTWIKTGSMIGYMGSVSFVREGIVEHGLGRMVSKAVTREGTRLTKAKGKGQLFLADQGKKITILELEQNSSLVVNGNDLLALQKGIKWEVRAMKQFAAVIAGGLFNIHLRGMGQLAITTHYDPLVLKVTRDRPVITDPNATVAWSGHLTPKVKTDMQMKTLVGRGSGETIQMEFRGEGYVVLQPFEEASKQGE